MPHALWYSPPTTADRSHGEGCVPGRAVFLSLSPAVVRSSGFSYSPSRSPSPLPTSSDPAEEEDERTTRPTEVGLPTPPASPVVLPRSGPPFDEDELDIDNRAMMDELMHLPCYKEECDMATEIVMLVIPRARLTVLRPEEEAATISRWLCHWVSLTPHPLCVLISTVILIERLRALHPDLSASVSLDASLRVTFAAFLIASKFSTEITYLNKDFTTKSPWSQKDVNAMEKELLGFLNYDVFISPSEILARARPFWSRRDVELPGWGVDSGEIDLSPGGLLGENLFLHGTGGLLAGAVAWLASRFGRWA